MQVIAASPIAGGTFELFAVKPTSTNDVNKAKPVKAKATTSKAKAKATTLKAKTKTNATITEAKAQATGTCFRSTGSARQRTTDESIFTKL